MTTTDRALMPDYLRIFALFGIVVVNVLSIAFSFEASGVGPIGEVWIDQFAGWLVLAFATMKSFSLFSFMFGVGLGFLMRAAGRRGQAFGRLYRNRMIGLLLLGLAHGCLFYPGDILVTYAIFGTILYFCRNWSVKSLVRAAVIIIVLHMLVGAPLTTVGYLFATPEELYDAATVAVEQDVNVNGTFVDVFALRTDTYSEILIYIVLVQGTQVLGWFWLGLAAVKAGVIDNAAHPVWRKARMYFLVPGVGLSALAAYMWQWGDLAFGAGLSYAAAPISTIGYLGVIAAIARPAGPLMSKVLVAGRNSLTVYLGQSIVLSTVFAGYGLGLWGQVGEFAAVLIAIGVTIILMWGVVLWCRVFRLGPFEWVLRRFTYLGQAKTNP